MSLINSVIGKVATLGQTLKVAISIRNYTNTDIVDTEVHNWDTFDYPGVANPRKALHGKRIPKTKELFEKMDVNGNASTAPFTIYLRYSDGKSDRFRVNMKALYHGSFEFDVHSAHHKMTIRNKSNDGTVVINIEEKEAATNRIDESQEMNYGIVVSLGGISMS